MELITKAVIMAGGEGTRLRPYTKFTPKCMLEIKDIPLLRIIIEKLHRFGINHFYLSVNYLSMVICDYFGNGTDFGVKITYIREPYSMGTAGSISLVDIQEPFLVINGDIYTDLDFKDFFVAFRESCSNLFICCRKEILRTEYGVLETDGSCVRAWKEKPEYSHLISCGIYMFTPNITDLIPKGHYFGMNHLAEEAIKKRRVEYYVMPSDRIWLDIGTVEDYETIIDFLNRKD